MKTTNQIKNAPYGAIYVWKTNGSLWYPRDIAREYGRYDLTFVSTSHLNHRYLADKHDMVFVIDHAVNSGEVYHLINRYEVIFYE